MKQLNFYKTRIDKYDGSIALYYNHQHVSLEKMYDFGEEEFYL